MFKKNPLFCGHEFVDFSGGETLESIHEVCKDQIEFSHAVLGDIQKEKAEIAAIREERKTLARQQMEIIMGDETAHLKRRADEDLDDTAGNDTTN